MRTLFLLVAALALAGVTAGSASARVAKGADLTADFSEVGAGNVMDPRFFRSLGLTFPEEQCAPDCAAWRIEMIQGDDALPQPPGRRPIVGRFTRPVSAVSLRIAPSLQGTAVYILRAFAASGRLVAERSLAVTQDTGDAGHTGFGYFTIDVSGLPQPVKSFSIDNVFLRSTFGGTFVTYGVGSVSFTQWPGSS